MAKVNIKSEKITPFGGIFPVMDKFTKLLGPVIDKSIGDRYMPYGYLYITI